VIVEKGALISHKACIHGAVVKSGALVGIGAIVLDGAVIGERALVGASALVTPGMVVPEGMLMLGQPAKAVRPLRTGEQRHILAQLDELASKATVYRRQLAQ
jgi:carbonic anhydrase/acetyltransferase-like protein (isoleucine patch superfamily)